MPAGQACGGTKPVLVDKGTYGSFGSSFSQVWSPDSKWIAYQRDLDNQLNAIFLYSMDTHKFTQVTDGMSDACSPAFDLNGKYLYFLASTDDGPSNAGIDLSSLDRAQTSAPYVVVLAKDGASPVPPRKRRREDQGRKEGGTKKSAESPTKKKDDKHPNKSDDKNKTADKDTAKSDDKDQGQGQR